MILRVCSQGTATNTTSFNPVTDQSSGGHQQSASRNSIRTKIQNESILSEVNSSFIASQVGNGNSIRMV